MPGAAAHARLRAAKFPAHEFIRRGDPHHLFHLGHGFHGFQARGHVAETNDTDYNSLFSLDGVNLVAEVLDLFAHFVDLFPAGVESHRDNHGLNLSIIFHSSKLKTENP